jgi:small subunit ribosomal protein S21
LHGGVLFGGLFQQFRNYFIMSLDVKVRKGEPMERALRRLKKRLDREGVIRDVRANRYFEKPSQSKRRKRKELDFNNMLRVRYSNM